MINVLGQDNIYIKRAKGNDVHLHMYHKFDARDNRKIGHITIVNDNKDVAIKIKQNIIKE
jgi:phosphoribosylaminoimidazole carboxylase (NCAIR synthetase)